MDSFDKKAKKILEGAYNSMNGENKELSKQRMLVCDTCNIRQGNFCSRKLGGCGCFLPWKTTVESEQCPKNKW